MLMILTDKHIRDLCWGDKPLVGGARHFEEQLGLYGFDLGLKSVWRIASAATLTPGHSDDVRARAERLDASSGIYDLTHGAYLVEFNEHFFIPEKIICLTMPKASLLAAGADIRTTAMEPGYDGQLSGLLSVSNPSGIQLAVDSTLVRAYFMQVATHDEAAFREVKELDASLMLAG